MDEVREVAVCSHTAKVACTCRDIAVNPASEIFLDLLAEPKAS